MRAPTHLHIPKTTWRRMPAAPTFEGRPLPHPDEPVFDQGLGTVSGSTSDGMTVELAVPVQA
jgi:hypothetical protein